LQTIDRRRRRCNTIEIRSIAVTPLPQCHCHFSCP
jgi:hypothetical protein